MIFPSISSVTKFLNRPGLKNFSIGLVPYLVFDILNLPFRKNPDKDVASQVSNEAFDKLRELKAPKVLELGSRNVTGVLRNDIFPNASEYVGFDILEGENVDVVGDVHQLSKYVGENSFDIVFSTSTFEHLLFPWKAALEINKVLKVGGYVVTATHTAWPEHEMPWDFWRFPKNSFHAMFNKATGYEIERLIEGRPMRAFPLYSDKPMRYLCIHKINGLVFCLARKTKDYDAKKLAWDIDIEDVVDTMYPAKK